MPNLRSNFRPCILFIVRRTKQQLNPSNHGSPDHADDAARPDEGPEAQPVDRAKTLEGKEIGGPVGPEPTRFGDWERKGRCIDF